MTACLVTAKVDLQWADDQYWCVLFKVIREITDINTPKEKKKVTASEMSHFIRDE